jgi:hypothetical protein
MSAQRTPNFFSFLFKETFHMINSCDPDVAGWSNGGTSFTIYDFKRLEDEYLPKYFNHSKSSSFQRQLNFYGFQKLRGEPDLQTHTESVRFAHEYFRKGRSDLLHKIQRSTAQPNNPAVPQFEESQVEMMQRQIEKLQEKIKTMERTMDEKVEEVRAAVTKEYVAHIQQLEASYGSILEGIVHHLTATTVSPKRTHVLAHWIPATSIGPLMSQMDPNVATLPRKNQSV